MTEVLEQVSPQAAAGGGGQAGGDTVDGKAGQRGQSEPAKPGQRSEKPGGEETQPSLGDGVADQIGSVARHLFGFASSTLSVLGGLLLILFVAIFVAIDAETYRDGLMHLFPHKARGRAREVLSATGGTLRRWLFTQFVSMVLVGVLTAVVLLVMGIEAAVALGIIAGILEFVPIAGPIMASVPAIAMGFLDGPEKAVYVALAYVAIQQIESNVIYPLLMKKGLELPPVLTIFTQGVLATVFGFIGLLVAVPMLAAAMVPIKMLYVEDKSRG